MTCKWLAEAAIWRVDIPSYKKGECMHFTPCFSVFTVTVDMHFTTTNNIIGSSSVKLSVVQLYHVMC